MEVDRPNPVSSLTYKPQRRRSSIIPLSRRLSVMSVDRRPSTIGLISAQPANGEKVQGEYVWKPGDANPKAKDKHGVKNAIDSRSLYAVRRENIASREMNFLARPPAQRGGDSVKNIEQLIEKNYIMGSRLSNATPEKFPKVIMPRFHRVSDTDEGISYGMPRPPTRTAFQRVMDDIKREPTIVQIPQCPSLHDPVRCNKSDEFCDVLGPSSCQSCIENTNRFIGEQLQDMVFPMIDTTTDKLIAPKLARLLKNGHKLQVRKRRLRELGIDNQETRFGSMTSRAKPLTASTCQKCKKPVAKLPVTSPVKSSR